MSEQAIVEQTTRSQPATVANETQAVLSMIERVALNPEADIDKLERMIDLQERILNRNAEQSFNAAMSDAQRETGRISADATNPQTRSKYATYAALDRVLRPIYTKHGFSLSFDTGDAPEGHVRVVCYVAHRDGHSRTYHADMPSDGLGAKGGAVMTKTHAAGSAMSYGQRYLLKLIFNVAVGEDDDDGNTAGGGRGPLCVTPAQIAEIRKAAKAAGVDDSYICQKAQIERIEDLPQQRVQGAISHLNSKAKKAKESNQ